MSAHLTSNRFISKISILIRYPNFLELKISFAYYLADVMNAYSFALFEIQKCKKLAKSLEHKYCLYELE